MVRKAKLSKRKREWRVDVRGKQSDGWGVELEEKVIVRHDGEAHALENLCKRCWDISTSLSSMETIVDSARVQPDNHDNQCWPINGCTQTHIVHVCTEMCTQKTHTERDLTL